MKRLIYKELGDRLECWVEKRNVTLALHLLYIWEEFERCLSGGALHRGGECYVWDVL